MNNIIAVSGMISSGKDLFTQLFQWVTSPLIQHDYPNYYDYLEACKQFGSPGLSKKLIYPGYQNMKFATKLKQMVSILTGIPVEDLEKIEVKNSFLSDDWDIIIPDENGDAQHKPMAVREMLQKLGTEAMRNGLHPNVWVNALFADIKDTTKCVISDVRFPNEANKVKERGGIMIRLNRNTGDKPKTNLHSSETGLDTYDNFDYVYQNDGTIEDLLNFITDLCQKEHII